MIVFSLILIMSSTEEDRLIVECGEDSVLDIGCEDFL